MQLKLTRTQGKSLTGKVIFALHAIALLTDEERANIEKYRLHKETIWAKAKVDPTDAQSTLGAIGKIAAAMAFNIRLTIDDLQKGRTFECREITEMLVVENELREACEVLQSVLNAAAHFGGSELIDINAALEGA